MILGALQMDGGLSPVTVQELLAANADTTNLCFGSGAHDRVSVNWVVAADGGTPTECTLDAQEPLGECLRRAVCAWRFPASASPTSVRGTWEGLSPPLRPPLRASEPAVEAAIEAQASGLADCAQLGKLVARLIVGSEGAVLGATFPFRSDTLGAQTEACALGVVTAWRLPPSAHGPSMVEASFLFAQTPERFALLGEQSGHHVTTEQSPSGSRRSIIENAINRSLPAISACNGQRDPYVTGRLRVVLDIGPTGSVTSAAAEDVTLPDAKLIACVLDAFRGLQYPPAPLEGGGTLRVTYPIAFLLADGGTEAPR